MTKPDEASPGPCHHLVNPGASHEDWEELPERPPRVAGRPTRSSCCPTRAVSARCDDCRRATIPDQDRPVRVTAYTSRRRAVSAAQRREQGRLCEGCGLSTGVVRAIHNKDIVDGIFRRRASSVDREVGNTIAASHGTISHRGSSSATSPAWARWGEARRQRPQAGLGGAGPG